MAGKGGIRVPVVTTVDTKDLAKMTAALDGMKKKVDKQAAGFATLGKAVKGAFAIGAVTAAIGKMISEGQQAEVVGARTANVLKTTGAAAWTSSKQINDLATSLSNKTGVDDEAIQSSENLLLTFKNVINAGKGQAAVFDRATTAALDLSKAGFGDLTSTSKMLGKALNDPAKGLTALGRAGVTFNSTQKEQIKAMQQRGDLLGAQQIVLKEVESQVGGAAAASATPMERLQTIFNNLMEVAGTGLLPALTTVISSLTPIITALNPVFEKLGVVIGQVVDALMPALIPAIEALLPVINPLLDVVVMLVKALMPAVSMVLLFAAGLLKTLLPAILPVLNIITPLAQVLNMVLAPALKLISWIIENTVMPIFNLLLKGLGFVIEGVAFAARKLNDATGGMIPGLDNLATKLSTAADGMKTMKLASTDLANAPTAAMATTAAQYKGAAIDMHAGAKAAAAAGKVMAGASRKATGSRVTRAPRTSAKAPRTVSSSGSQSFTVGGSGGGLSLSVTVNGSVIQEKDIARTIRDELIQFGRRVGKPVALGV